MLEIVKYGTNKYGVWVLGLLKYNNLEFYDIFSTNLKDEELLKSSTSLKVKKLKISKNRNRQIVFAIEV